MRVNRKLLFAGAFLLAIGGVIVAVQAGVIDTDVIASALRLWPLAIVAIGAGIALRRTELGLPAGVLGAVIPGLVLGGAVALAPTIPVDCMRRELAPVIASYRHGEKLPAHVTFTRRDGDVHVTVNFGTVEIDPMGGCT